MATEVMAWNVDDGLGDPERAAEIVNALRMQSPDVIYLSEAFSPKAEGYSTLAVSQEQIADMGYTLGTTLYEDADDREDAHGMLMASRIGPVSVVRLATRNALLVDATDPYTAYQTEIAGVHLDDHSEAARQIQLCELIRLKPGVVIGDFNGFHADNTMKLLKQHGYSDLDRKHQPTFPSKRPFVQPDHIMGLEGFSVDWVEVQEHIVTSDNNPLSDHRAVMGRLYLASI